MGDITDHYTTSKFFVLIHPSVSPIQDLRKTRQRQHHRRVTFDPKVMVPFEDHAPPLVATVILLLVLGCIVLPLRVYIRAKRNAMDLDDWCMIIAAVSLPYDRRTCSC